MPKDGAMPNKAVPALPAKPGEVIWNTSKIGNAKIGRAFMKVRETLKGFVPEAVTVSITVHRTWKPIQKITGLTIMRSSRKNVTCHFKIEKQLALEAAFEFSRTLTESEKTRLLDAYNGTGTPEVKNPAIRPQPGATALASKPKHPPPSLIKPAPVPIAVAASIASAVLPVTYSGGVVSDEQLRAFFRSLLKAFPKKPNNISADKLSSVTREAFHQTLHPEVLKKFIMDNASTFVADLGGLSWKFDWFAVRAFVNGSDRPKVESYARLHATDKGDNIVEYLRRYRHYRALDAKKQDLELDEAFLQSKKLALESQISELRAQISEIQSQISGVRSTRETIAAEQMSLEFSSEALREADLIFQFVQGLAN